MHLCIVHARFVHSFVQGVKKSQSEESMLKLARRSAHRHNTMEGGLNGIRGRRIIGHAHRGAGIGTGIGSNVTIMYETPKTMAPATSSRACAHRTPMRVHDRARMKGGTGNPALDYVAI